MCDDADHVATPMSRRRFVGSGAAAGVVAVGGMAAGGRALGRTSSPEARVERRPRRLDEPVRRRWRGRLIGWSHEGRPIEVYENRAETPRSSVLVIAGVHGDERGTVPVANELLTVPIETDVDAFVVPIANPDGWERATRNNAADRDLNRNFPSFWQSYDGGPSPASEPETKALMAVVEQLRPTVTVWVHEPYEYVGHVNEEARRFAEAWAAGSRLPTRSVTQHGGGETWTAYGAGLPSVLVEGSSRDLSLDDLRRHRRGFEELLAIL